jgi:hypothetical protein
VIKHPFDSDDMDRTMPQTEDSAERGHVRQRDQAEPETYRDLGESSELDQDEGDIADEGSGHRG